MARIVYGNIILVVAMAVAVGCLAGKKEPVTILAPESLFSPTCEADLDTVREAVRESMGQRDWVLLNESEGGQHMLWSRSGVSDLDGSALDVYILMLLAELTNDRTRIVIFYHSYATDPDRGLAFAARYPGMYPEEIRTVLLEIKEYLATHTAGGVAQVRRER